MVALAIRELRVTLEKKPILRGIDLHVESGEWINIIGPNGAGKTTLLRTLIGSVSADGEILIAGKRVLKPALRAKTIAYVAQSPVVPPGMAVIDYVLLGRTPHRGIFAGDSAEDLSIATEVLTRLDLREFADREVSSLSGGERQRAVLARAFTQQTDVLLLDEPTTALDLGHQQEVLDLVDELRRERNLTVVATMHDLTLAARYGDRIALLADGELHRLGPAADVLTVENIATYFHANVRIIDDGEGPVIVPTTEKS